MSGRLYSPGGTHDARGYDGESESTSTVVYAGITRRLFNTHTRARAHPLSGTTRVSRYQKGKTNLDFTEARDSEWQWHQLGHMQVCTSLQTNNHARTPPLSFLQAGCPSCRPTNSVKALKALRRLLQTCCKSLEQFTSKYCEFFLHRQHLEIP